MVPRGPGKAAKTFGDAEAKQHANAAEVVDRLRLSGGHVPLAVALPYLRGIRRFAEPCAGDGALD
jgi:hypothetical protein